MNKQWRIEDKEAKRIIDQEQNCLNQEVKEGNKRMLEEEKQRQVTEKEANREIREQQHSSNKTIK